MPELSISTIKPNELECAASVVATSFLDNPADHIQAVWKGSDKKILKQNERLFRLLFKAEGKEVYVVKDGHEIIAVYAIQHSRFRHMSTLQQAKLLLPMLRATGSNLPRLIYWHDRWSRIAPSQEHLSLSPMCVLPEAQGKGVGKLMLNHLCENLDQRHLGGYLETGKWENVQIYKKHGFTVRQEVNIYTARTWTMWREPKDSLML